MAMSVEEMIKNSQCFGVAFDSKVPECKTCDVKTKCEAKCRSASKPLASKPLPTLVAEVEEITTKVTSQPKVANTEKENKPSAQKQEKTVQQPTKKTVKETVTSKSYSSDMPEFKTLSMEQLEEIAVQRGANLADFEKFTAPNIRRMRLTMFLKKTFEV